MIAIYTSRHGGTVIWDDQPLCVQQRINQNRHALGLPRRGITALWDVVESQQRTEELVDVLDRLSV